MLSVLSVALVCCGGDVNLPSVSRVTCSRVWVDGGVYGVYPPIPSSG